MYAELHLVSSELNQENKNVLAFKNGSTISRRATNLIIFQACKFIIYNLK